MLNRVPKKTPMRVFTANSTVLTILYRKVYLVRVHMLCFHMFCLFPNSAKMNKYWLFATLVSRTPRSHQVHCNSTIQSHLIKFPPRQEHLHGGKDPHDLSLTQQMICLSRADFVLSKALFIGKTIPPATPSPRLRQGKFGGWVSSGCASKHGKGSSNSEPWRTRSRTDRRDLELPFKLKLRHTWLIRRGPNIPKM